MYEVYQELIDKQQRDLIRGIKSDYKLTDEELINLVEKSINEKGKKEKEANKAISALIFALWFKNKKRINTSSESIMSDTWLFYEYIAALKLNKPSTILTNKEIAGIINKISKKRQKLIKWDKVINGNSRRLDRQVKNIIKTGVKKGKTNRQIQADIRKKLKISENKAKTIARTETNFYKSESKLQVAKHQELVIVKTWVYTYLSKEPRAAHKVANGQTVIGADSKFLINGHETIAPQHFGIASEDINCTCDFKMEYTEDVDASASEFNKYKEGKNEI